MPNRLAIIYKVEMIPAAPPTTMISKDTIFIFFSLLDLNAGVVYPADVVDILCSRVCTGALSLEFRVPKTDLCHSRRLDVFLE